VATELAARVRVKESGADMAQVQGTAMATAMATARVMVMGLGAARARVQGVAKGPGTATAAAPAIVGTAGMEKVVMGLGRTVTLTVIAVMAIREDTTATVSPAMAATPARVPTPAKGRVTVMGKGTARGTAKAQGLGTDRLLTVAARMGAAAARDQRVEPGLLGPAAARDQRAEAGLLREMAVIHRLQVPPAVAVTAQHRLKAHTAFTLRNHRRCESIV
jgi:hypothetical protein